MQCLKCYFCISSFTYNEK